MFTARTGQNRLVDERTSEQRRAAELLGELARELSVLVRRDVEVAAAERLPILRRALLDLAAVSVVALAGVLALGAASFGAGNVMSTLMPAWAAAFAVAGAWALIAVVLLAVLVRPRAQPREREELLGLLQMLARDNKLEQLRESREQARDDAEREMRQTAGTLMRTALDEAAEHQLEALPQLARREVERAEADASDVLLDAVSLLTAPARASWRALERLIEPPPVPRRPRPHDGRRDT